MNLPHSVLGNSNIGRRDLFKAGATGLLGAGLSGTVARPEAAAHSVSNSTNKLLKIATIDRITVDIPFREVPKRNMAREIPHWTLFEICSVKLKSGHVGYGESMLYYSWGVTSDEAVKTSLGRNAAEIMWDESLGSGLQMALFDAVGKAMDAPVHALLGKKINETTPLSWWDIDMPPEDWASECKLAHKMGYMSFKTKGRPWFDVYNQVAAAARVVPTEFKLDVDFNDTLLDSERAIPILTDLEKTPQVDIYETPIPQSDIEGNQKIRAATRVAIAMHYGSPKPITALKEEVCDGFVVGGSARQVMDAGAVADIAEKPFWLQLVGTGITAAFSLHFGGVLRQAKWPAVNCHQLYTHDLLAEPISVKNGHARVPDGPGLGHDIDLDALENFRVEKPKERPEPMRLIEVKRPNGRKIYISNTGNVNFMIHHANAGRIPFYERGVQTSLVPDDGSSKWRDLYERARKAPVTVGG